MKGKEPAEWMRVGGELRGVGRLSEAAEMFEEAVGLFPGEVGFLNNWGVVLAEMGRWGEAVEIYKRVVERKSEATEVWNNLGNALKEVGDLDGAVEALSRAIELEGGNAEAWNNLGAVREERGEWEEGMGCYRRSLGIRRSARVHSNLLYGMQFGEVSDKELMEEHERWAERYAPVVRVNFSNRADSEKRLKVGYVSPDFWGHPVGRFIRPILEGHDRSVVEVYCYSNGRVVDEMTGRIRAAADCWREIVGVSDEVAEGMMRADGIDVLVDLSVHMAGNRQGLFGRRPAPVGVTYLGYNGTAGNPGIGYRITDRWMGEGVGAERVVEVEGYWGYEEFEVRNSKFEARAKFEGGRGEVVFGCLNSFRKVNERVLRVWGKILREVEGARLVVHAKEGSHRQWAVERLGVSGDRVEFVGLVGVEEYFGVWRRVDVGLDPFPYSGGTTTCDGLWMGVPVVTLEGKTPVGRGGVGILNGVGLGELVAHSEEEYVRIAVGLARDIEKRKRLRKELRGRMESSALMDAGRMARDLEEAYRFMWREWCEKGD